MRVRDLLTMTTGHADDPTERVFQTGDWVRAFLAEPVEHEPGTFFVYNTAGTHMLAALVQKVTGQRLLDYLGPGCSSRSASRGRRGSSRRAASTSAARGCRGPPRTSRCSASCTCRTGSGRGAGSSPRAGSPRRRARRCPTTTNPDIDWAQGYGYQFWRGRHGSFRGDGAFGQYCVVLPEQDVVVVTTSGVGEMHGQLRAGVGAPPAGAVATVRCPRTGRAAGCSADRLASLRLDPPHGAPTSPTGARLSGQTITFEPNTLGIRNAVLEVGDGHDRLTVDHEEETVIVSVGHAQPALTRTTLRRSDPEDVLVSGAWTTPDTYVLTFRFVESPFVVTATATFDGEDVVVEGGFNVAFGPTESPPAGGQGRPGGGGGLGRLSGPARSEPAQLSSRTVHQSLTSRLR